MDVAVLNMGRVKGEGIAPASLKGEDAEVLPFPLLSSFFPKI
jgi:hypothetical protein